MAELLVAAPRQELIADTDYVARQLNTETTIVDARPVAHYTGAVTQAGVVVRPGHLPGAINIENAGFYDPSTGRFNPIEVLIDHLPSNLSDRSAPIVTYCSIGQAASFSWFVLHELLGFENVRLYEASLAAWSRHAELPLLVGPAP